MVTSQSKKYYYYYCYCIFRDIVDYLLANGASLIVHDLVTKRTPLHAAGNYNDIVCVLLTLFVLQLAMAMLNVSR